MDLSRFSAVLLDLDGTLWHEDRALPGATDLVARMNQRGQRWACLSNNAGSPAGIAQRLRRLGIEVASSHIYSAANAVADYVLQNLPAPRHVFNLATDGIYDVLSGQVHWVQSPTAPCDAVIAGVPANVYATEDRQRTALALLREGAKLIGICADRVYPSPRGLEFGSGAFCAMLGYAADVRPIFVGKPDEKFFQELAGRLEVDLRECVVIGDNLESDIAGAKRLGMTTILTLTGVAQQQDAVDAPEHLRPDAVVRDLRELR